MLSPSSELNCSQSNYTWMGGLGSTSCLKQTYSCKGGLYTWLVSWFYIFYFTSYHCFYKIKKLSHSNTNHTWVRWRGWEQAGGNGLSWQSMKHSQCFVSSRESAQKLMKASSNLTFTISIVFEVWVGHLGQVEKGVSRVHMPRWR